MRSFAHTALITIFFILLSSPAYSKIDTYLGELRRATHRGQAFDTETWDAKVIWYATFFSDRFRKAFDEKHAKINHMGPIEKSQWLNDENYRQNRQWEFFISFYTKKDYKKFSLESDSFWEIYLMTGDGKVVWPTSIDQIPITPYEKIMFRHINRWSKGYRVTFPKVPLGDSIILTLQSIVGQSSLEWKFYGDSKKQDHNIAENK